MHNGLTARLRQSLSDKLVTAAFSPLPLAYTNYPERHFVYEVHPMLFLRGRSIRLDRDNVTDCTASNKLLGPSIRGMVRRCRPRYQGHARNGGGD